MTQSVYMNIPSQDMKFLQELASKMGWDILDKTPAINTNKKTVDKLYGSVSLPEGYDYKEDIEKILTEKYL